MNKYILSLCIFATALITGCISDDKMNPDNTSTTNFDLLWKLVDEKYCYLNSKNIDWEQIGKQYRSKLRDDMTEEELFELCGNMLYHLKDGHVNIFSDFNISRNWSWYLDYPLNFNMDIIHYGYLEPDFNYVGPLMVKKFNNIGYIYYGSFQNELSDSNIETALKVLGSVDGLIIDVRGNGGGSLAYAQTFTGCFVKTKTRIGFQRYKEGKGHNDLSEWYGVYAEPKLDKPFNGQIIVLTNRESYSAANYFASYMKALPNVTIMGDNTGGGGAMPLTFELYNGWSVRMSMDPAYTVDKEDIEPGIAPDIRVSMSQNDALNNIDTILEEAILKLSGRYYKKSK